jgi:hypothetical protein
MLSKIPCLATVISDANQVSNPLAREANDICGAAMAAWPRANAQIAVQKRGAMMWSESELIRNYWRPNVLFIGQVNPIWSKFQGRCICKLHGHCMEITPYMIAHYCPRDNEYRADPEEMPSGKDRLSISATPLKIHF